MADGTGRPQFQPLVDAKFVENVRLVARQGNNVLLICEAQVAYWAVHLLHQIRLDVILPHGLAFDKFFNRLAFPADAQQTADEQAQHSHYSQYQSYEGQKQDVRNASDTLQYDKSDYSPLCASR